METFQRIIVAGLAAGIRFSRRHPWLTLAAVALAVAWNYYSFVMATAALDSTKARRTYAVIWCGMMLALLGPFSPAFALLFCAVTAWRVFK